MARKGTKWMAMGATGPFSHLSCGYVGASDGWTDLHDHFTMQWEFERASNGNIALTGELDLSETQQFNPSLTIIANAIRIAYHLLAERLK